MFTGASDGNVVHWKNGDMVKQYENCKGAVQSVACRKEESTEGELVLVGGSDKTLSVYKFADGLKKLWSVECDA